MEPSGQAPQKREKFAYEHLDTGRFIFPEENTWAATTLRVKNPDFGIGFNTAEYAYFDGIIAEKLRLDALTNPKNPDYKNYGALRTNIAGLRNFILTHYEDSGLFAADMDMQLGRLRNIATFLGESLANDKPFTRALTKSSSMEVANIEGVGACEMYKYLLENMERPTASEGVTNMFNNLKAYFLVEHHDFRLPELELTPFSPAALAAPPPGFVSSYKPPTETDGGDGDLRSQNQYEEAIREAEQQAKTASSLYSIETLAEAPREESVEEARKILRNLRNMQFTEQNLETFLSAGSQAAIAEKKQSFSRLADIFAAHHNNAALQRPGIRNNPAVEQARDTVATIVLELLEHTRRQLHSEELRIEEWKRDHAEEHLSYLIDALPDACEHRINQPVERLLDTLELGLGQLTGQQLDATHLDQLAQAAQNSHHAAMELQNAEQLQAHTHEENVAHARETLQQLARMVQNRNQSMEEFIETSTLPEKAQFAKQVEELSIAYRNLMAEALRAKPDLAQDEAVKQANDAVGGFSSAVKLMATKEIPNSIAAAQQISADITQEPGQWKDLHHRAVDRLVKSAEGGLEKAIAEVGDDEEEQAEDIAQDLMDVAVSNDNSKRKKRRRGEGKSRSDKKAKKQRKKVLDLSADDRHLKQGRFAEDDNDRQTGTDIAKALASKTQKDIRKVILDTQADDRIMGQGRFAEDRAPPPGDSPARNSSRNKPPSLKLSQKDMDAIQKLGGSLRGMTTQASTLNPNIQPENKPNDRDPSKRNKGGPNM